LYDQRNAQQIERSAAHRYRVARRFAKTFRLTQQGLQDPRNHQT